MKKSFIGLIMLATMAIPAQAQSYKEQIQELTDSANAIMGSTMAKMLINEQPDINIERVIEGFESANNADESFKIGVKLAQFLEAKGIGDNTGTFIKAFRQGSKGPSASQEELEQQLEKASLLTQQIIELQVKENANTPEALAAKKNGEKYIAKMLLTKKYTRTASGLMYRVITPGEGEHFSEGDNILLKYVGRLVDGTVVEDSEGEAERRPVDVTDGCHEMLMLMKPGMKVEAIIPARLAYGIYGNYRGNIGPNETLVFEIETIGLAPDNEEYENAEGKDDEE